MLAAYCNVCTFCPSFIARQSSKRAIPCARVCNLQILRGCYRAGEYVLLREYGNSENKGDSRTRPSPCYRGCEWKRGCRVGERVTRGWLFSPRERDHCGVRTTIRVCDRNIGMWKGYSRYVVCVHLSRLTSARSLGEKGGGVESLA